MLGLLLQRHFIRSMQKVSMSLKKQQRHRDRDKAQSGALAQVARAVRGDIKERDRAARQLAEVQLQIYMALLLSDVLYQERLCHGP